MATEQDAQHSSGHVRNERERNLAHSRDRRDAGEAPAVRPLTRDGARASELPLPKVSALELVSYLFMLALMVLALTLKLLGTLLAGLLVYQVIHIIAPRLEKRLPSQRARWFAVVIVSIVVIGGLTGVTLAVIEHVEKNAPTVQRLLDQVVGFSDQARQQLPAWAIAYIPNGAAEMETKLLALVHQHSTQLTEGGKDAMRGLAHVLIGMILGAMIAVSAQHHAHRMPLAALLTRRVSRFADAFRRIVFAQIKISAINAFFTGMYLLVALPMFHLRLPLSKTLVIVAFVVGLLPVIGNLISNALIVMISLTAGIGVAVASLTFLIVIHKLEYFLNARIVGGEIEAKAWELLIAMLVMEAAFGIFGVIAAPIYYAYIKRELVLSRLV
jgi:predicted PurR-regulated permease PerM